MEEFIGIDESKLRSDAKIPEFFFDMLQGFAKNVLNSSSDCQCLKKKESLFKDPKPRRIFFHSFTPRVRFIRISKMDSFASSELQQVESEDYIMVQMQHAEEMRDDLSDDESYDYCEDVYSIHSNGSTPSICSEVHGSVLTVPSVLLKDLDEAHAAAALAIQDSEEQKSVASSVTKGTDLSIANKDTRSNKAQSKPENETSSKKITLSRTSNKKRRKQLKMLKKAQAAENAAKALAEKAGRTVAGTSGLTKKSSNKAKKATNSGRSKRVHPHVACATETLASYREEVRMMAC